MPEQSTVIMRIHVGAADASATTFAEPLPLLVIDIGSLAVAIGPYGPHVGCYDVRFARELRAAVAEFAAAVERSNRTRARGGDE